MEPGPAAPLKRPPWVKGYGPVDVDPLALSYYRYAWATNDLASFAQEILFPAPDDPTQGAEAMRFFGGLLGPHGIVASAIVHDVER